MTMTPPRATRTARGRTRRRVAGEPRHAAAAPHPDEPDGGRRPEPANGRRLVREGAADGSAVGGAAGSHRTGGAGDATGGHATGESAVGGDMIGGRTTGGGASRGGWGARDDSALDGGGRAVGELTGGYRTARGVTTDTGRREATRRRGEQRRTDRYGADRQGRHAAAGHDDGPGPGRRTLARRATERPATAVEPVAPVRDGTTAAAVAEPVAAVAGASAYRKEPERRRAPGRHGYLGATLLRCGLYLGPLSVAVAAAGPLGRVAWPVPLVTLLLGWAAAQALTGVGITVARRSGPNAAAGVVGRGFAAIAALWCALAWIAPDPLLGPDRALAATVGLGGLATLATVTAALVTRAEAAIVRWSVPCWLLAGAALTWPALPVATLLPAAIVAVAVRAFRPALLPGRRPAYRLAPPDVRRGTGHLIIGASQAICVALLWRLGPAGVVAVPLLLSVPVLEALIAWHSARLEAGLDAAESIDELARHIRNITVITLAGLLPPLAAGGVLALAGTRLTAVTMREPLLALAAGMLLAGVIAVTALLCTRARTGLAATLAAAPALALVSLTVLPLPDTEPLPAIVAVLVATHVAGLFLVALTAADLRRTQ